MQIIIAQHAGFCEGVERAYRIALEQAKAGQPVFMLGNLVHNTQVIEKLKSLNIKLLKNLAEVPAGVRGTLLISAHGVSPEIYAEAQAKGLGVIDTTCAWVKKSQNIARQLTERGLKVIIVGDRGHAEVKGLVGWAGGDAEVVESVEDIEKLKIDPAQKIGVLAQTTQSEANFNAVVKKLKEIYPVTEVHNTICGATSKRQTAAVELARQVDLMLIIGDTMSANTKRLTELCRQTGTETHQIQTAQELNLQWLTGKTKIGLTAGASTPDWVIKEVVEKLEQETPGNEGVVKLANL